jgi:mono/diheme cytochrome c family protein
MKKGSEGNRETGTKHVPSNVLRPATAIALLLAAFSVGLSSLAHAQTRPPQNQPPRTQNAPAGNAQKGKDAFTTHMCATCHGPEGQGAVGPALAPPPRALGDFTRYVRQPAGKMPPFTPQAVSDTDLADIYAFLQSANPAPPSSLSALTGYAQNGSRIYVSYGCYECHGGVGQGAQQTGAPRIGPPALTIDAFARYIHQPSGNMPPYTSKVVSDQDVADIYAFLKSLPPAPPAKDIPLLNQ